MFCFSRNFQYSKKSNKKTVIRLLNNEKTIYKGMRESLQSLQKTTFQRPKTQIICIFYEGHLKSERPNQ